MSFKQAVDRQNQIHDNLLREIDEGLQAEVDYRKWYSDTPPTPPPVDARYTDAAQLAQWRQERG